MAEKPRIKDTDEILDSIGKKRGDLPPSAVAPSAAPPSAPPAQEMNGDGRPQKRRGRPRKTPPPGAGAGQPAVPPVLQQTEPESGRDFPSAAHEPPQPPKRRGRPQKSPQARGTGAPAQTMEWEDRTPAAPAPAYTPYAPPQAASAPPPARPMAAPSPATKPAPDAPVWGGGHTAPLEAPAPDQEGEAKPKQILRKTEAEAKAFDFNFVDLEEEQHREEEAQRAAEEAHRAEEERLAREEWERILRIQERQKQMEKEELERLRMEAENEAARAMQKANEEAERRRVEAEAEAERLRLEAEAEAERLRIEGELEAERRRREAEAKAARLQEENAARHKLLEDEEYRENIFGQLGNQFEQQFSRMFEGRQKAEAPLPWWLDERRKKDAGEEAPETVAEAEPEAPAAPQETVIAPEKLPAGLRSVLEELEDDGQDPSWETDRQADEFVDRFQEAVLREEKEEPPVDFRETLAEKFMRERERYLKELGIEEEMEKERAAREEEEKIQAVLNQDLQKRVQPRRKLDFHIQPEMHVQNKDTLAPKKEEEPPLAPVTYNRAAQPKPLQAIYGADDLPPPEPAILRVDGAKKSAEQLLLELGQDSKRRTVRKPQQSLQQFRFTAVDGPPEEEEEPAKKPRRKFSPLTRVVVVAAGVGVLMLSILISTLLSTESKIGEVIPEGGAPLSESVGDTLTALENFNPSTMTNKDEVVVKRSGLTLSNLTVKDNVYVDEEASAEGALTLQNMIVGNMIYVKNSGINQLNLQDVNAQKVIVNNPGKHVAVVVSGTSDIGSVEIRTPSALEMRDVPPEVAGIREVVVRNEGEGKEPLAVSVDKTGLQSVTTQGSAAVTFNETSVEDMSADGDLVLAGIGRVQSLSFGYNMGGGAANPAASMRKLPATLQVKGVELGRLNLKSAANVNLGSDVESLYVSDPVILGGGGTVGSLIFNEKAGSGRIPADITGLNIQQVITNAPTILQSSGSSVINTIKANASTYALGNKVNLLEVNADGVIFEVEPDAKRIEKGVDPPQSKAENPNLNYDLNFDFTQESANTLDATGDDVSTTCDHSRSVGGFLKGDGSKSNPFQVETPAQLAHVASHPKSYFLQMTDIDIASDSSFSAGFEMIGGGENERFSGEYDGGGYAIRNLRIAANSAEYVGLFAENTGVIRNLHIENGEVKGNSQSFVGAIVGLNYQGGTVEACSNGASVSGSDGSYVGGLVGYNYGGKIRNCYNTAKVTTGDAVGGIVGTNSQNGSVTSCYNIGVVEGQSSFGALVGINNAVVTNSYFLEGEGVKGVGSGGENATATARSASALSAAQMVADLSAGNDASPWVASQGSYPYPTLDRTADSADSGVSPTPAEAGPAPAPSAEQSMNLPPLAEQEEDGFEGVARFDDEEVLLDEEGQAVTTLGSPSQSGEPSRDTDSNLGRKKAGSSSRDEFYFDDAE